MIAIMLAPIRRATRCALTRTALGSGFARARGL
jgi:hypothetical protein